MQLFAYVEHALHIVSKQLIQVPPVPPVLVLTPYPGAHAKQLELVEHTIQLVGHEEHPFVELRP